MPSPYNRSCMRYLIALLAIAGLIDSALALRIHYQDPSQAPPCAVTAKFDCGAVNHSRYAVFPPVSFDEAPGSKKVHIPVAIFGIIGYGVIALTALAKLPADWLLDAARDMHKACLADWREFRRAGKRKLAA